MSVVRLLSAVFPMIVVAGCSSGPPECSGSEAQSVLKRLLEAEAKIYAILVTRPTRLYHEEMFMTAPSSLGLLQQQKFDEAFAVIEEKVLEMPDQGFAVLAKQALVAAKESTFELSVIATTAQTDRRSSCSVTVDFSLGLPTADQLTKQIKNSNLLESYVQAFDAVRTLRQQRKYDVYYTDSGETVVDLAAPE